MFWKLITLGYSRPEIHKLCTKPLIKPMMTDNQPYHTHKGVGRENNKLKLDLWSYCISYFSLKEYSFNCTPYTCTLSASSQNWSCWYVDASYPGSFRVTIYFKGSFNTYTTSSSSQVNKHPIHKFQGIIVLKAVFCIRQQIIRKVTHSLSKTTGPKYTCTLYIYNYF